MQACASEPEPSSLPHPSAELVIIRTGAQAIIRTLGRRKGERFIREWASLLANEEGVAMLFPARPASARTAVTKAQSEALAWMRMALPVFLASVTPE